MKIYIDDVSEDTRSLGNVYLLSKDEILQVQYFIVPRDARMNIDLGQHKHDPETVTHILTHLMKYWFVWHISPDSLLFPEPIMVSLSDPSSFERLEVEPYLSAISHNFDTSTFFEKLVIMLLLDGTIQKAWAYSFHDIDEMIQGAFPEDSYDPSAFEKAKAVLRNPYYKRFLPHFTEEFDNLTTTNNQETTK